MKAKVGDKVQIKAGDHQGERAVILSIEFDKLTLELAGSRKVVHTLSKHVTNYSLAARKAWATEPNRAVGRRKGTCITNRVSVTLRLDRELWELFLAKEKAGTIADRTAVVNRWFREKLDETDDGEPRT